MSGEKSLHHEGHEGRGVPLEYSLSFVSVVVNGFTKT